MGKLVLFLILSVIVFCAQPCFASMTHHTINLNKSHTYESYSSNRSINSHTLYAVPKVNQILTRVNFNYNVTYAY